MAAPVIDSIQVIYPPGKNSVAPGETAQIIVTAHDADSAPMTVSVVVTDAAGNQSSVGTATVNKTDALTYSADAAGGTITGGGSSNVFTFKA
jgi:hypothetical protein